MTSPKDPSAATFCLSGQGQRIQRPQPTVNLLLRHGVRSCLRIQKSGDLTKARAFRIRIYRHIFPSWIWAVMATRRYG